MGTRKKAKDDDIMRFHIGVGDHQFPDTMLFGNVEKVSEIAPLLRNTQAS